MMSRHHWIIVRIMVIRPSVRRINDPKWNHIASPDVSRRAATAPVRGQGLGSTMW